MFHNAFLLTFPERQGRREAEECQEAAFFGGSKSHCNDLGLTPFHYSFLLALPVSVFHGLPLVTLLLALGNSNFHLDLAALEIHEGWNQGEAFAVDEPDQTVYFAAVKQQFSRSCRIGIRIAGSGGQGVNVAAKQPGLVVFQQDIAVRKLHASLAQRFHFPTLKRDACFDAFLDVELEARTLVLGYGLAACVFLIGHLTLLT